MKRTKRMCMNDLMESLENEEKNSDLENNTKILKELVEQIKILNINIQQLLYLTHVIIKKKSYLLRLFLAFLL